MDQIIKSKKSDKQKSLSRSRNSKVQSNKKSRVGKQDGSTSQNTKRKVIDFIMKTAQSERKLQIIKQALAEVPTFTPASLFHRFDADRKNFILEKDIRDFLVESNISFKGSELKTLFGRIDVNQSQTISLRQFQDFILPNQDPKLRYQTVRRPVIISKPHQKLSKQIQYFTSKFFTQIIKQYKELAQINSTLKSSYDFNSQNVFALLSDQTGRITGQSIKKFIEGCGQQITIEEVGCLIKTIDKNGVAKVDSKDFDNFLATMGLKQTHQVFDQLSPIPALKAFMSGEGRQNLNNRGAQLNQLRQRYKNNKSYVKGMDQQAHHIPGYSTLLDPTVNLQKSYLKRSR